MRFTPICFRSPDAICQMMFSRAIFVPNCFCSISNCLTVDAVIFIERIGVVDADAVLVPEKYVGLCRLGRAW